MSTTDNHTLNFLNLCKNRKSIRKFSDRPVEKEKILLCLEAARLAPSACNSQPWKFIVIDEPQLKDKLTSNAFSGIYSTNLFAKKAPVIIVVISEKSSFIASVGAYLKDTRYYLIDIGIAVEHLVLQATESGLGSCWLGWFDEKSVKKILKIPDEKRVDLLIALGYPSENFQNTVKKNRKPIEEISSFNSYRPK